MGSWVSSSVGTCWVAEGFLLHMALYLWPRFSLPTASVSRPLQLSLVRLKNTDRGEQQGERWPLQKLRVVDGRDALHEVPDFDLHFEKVYKWTAASYIQKCSFMACLWKVNQRYLSGSIKFLNILPYLKENLGTQEDTGSEATPKKEELGEEGLYQEVTPTESLDILRLMEEHDPLMADVVTFTQKLTMVLQCLDEKNLRYLLSSKKQMSLLMELIEKNLVEAEKLERTLRVYEERLKTVKQQMDHIQEGNSLLHLIDSNRQKLRDEVFFLTEMLDFDVNHYHALNQGDLSTPAGIAGCVDAVEALSGCMSVKLNAGHRRLQSVSEQFIMFESLKQSFEKHFVSHITGIFKMQGKSQSHTLSQISSRLHFPQHRLYHCTLLPYTPLMRWLRASNLLLFQDLPKVYTQSLSRLYERQTKVFFETAKDLLCQTREGRRFSLQEGLEHLSSVTSLHPSYLRLSDTAGGSAQDTENENMASVLEQVLNELDSVCSSEQSFVESFFLLSEPGIPLISPQQPDGRNENAKSCEATKDTQPLKCRSEETGVQWLKDTLACIDPELCGLVHACNKVNRYSCLQILVTLGNFQVKAQHSPFSSFLCTLLSHVVSVAQENFHKCIASLCEDIEASKPPWWKKGGILPSVSCFQHFVSVSEGVFRATERRDELDQAHRTLLDAVFKALATLPSHELKVNADVVLMENYHNIHGFLSQVKIPSLEGKRQEAKQRYSQHLHRYVQKHLGQPLEKLNCFFDGVKALMARGVSEDEVGFQLSYSKHELRRAISSYPGRVVRQALETVYRKILKHLSHENSLLPVVWRAMEQEFLCQYTEFQELIGRCYPGSEVTMEFTMDDLLWYFSSITKAYH